MHGRPGPEFTVPEGAVPLPPAVKPEDRRRSPVGIAYVGEQSPHPVDPQRDPGRVSRAETVNGAGRRRPDVRCERKRTSAARIVGVLPIARRKPGGGPSCGCPRLRRPRRPAVWPQTERGQAWIYAIPPSGPLDYVGHRFKRFSRDRDRLESPGIRGACCSVCCSSAIVYSQSRDTVPKLGRNNAMARPSPETTPSPLPPTATGGVTLGQMPDIWR
jgi:hypothetical protein